MIWTAIVLTTDGRGYVYKVFAASNDNKIAWEEISSSIHDGTLISIVKGRHEPVFNNDGIDSVAEDR